MLLEKAHVASPQLTAEVLLMHALSINRAELYAHPEYELSEVAWIHYESYLNERLKGTPTQYITGHQEFWGLDFLVDPSVLIPRPETELVVEVAAELAARDFPAGEGCTIADIGTGSGCIAIAIAKELPQARIFALDCSPDALNTAHKNAVRLGVDQQIRFLCSDLLMPCGSEKLPPLHMVVSNPPYVSEKDREHVQKEVRDFEPSTAVFAGPSGLDIYARLIPQATVALATGGHLVMELGYDSQEQVTTFLASECWQNIEWRKDLARITRVVFATKIGE